MLLLIPIFFLSFSLEAKDIYGFSNENLEKDFIELSKEVSCPLCSGSSIAESDSDIANDLKNVIFNELENGKTPKEIKNNLIKLYGEGILFMPENKIYNKLNAISVSKVKNINVIKEVPITKSIKIVRVGFIFMFLNE